MFENEIKRWIPVDWLQFVFALCSIVSLFGIIYLSFFNKNRYMTHWDQFVTVHSVSPDEITIVRGDRFNVDFVYSKEENCEATITYQAHYTDITGVLHQHTFGPYAGGWVSGNMIRISQIYPKAMSELPPGTYNIFWKAIGSCGDRPVFTESPHVTLTIAQ